MSGAVEIATPAGPVRLRPERDDDGVFRYELFCVSRPPEWEQVQIPQGLREQLMRHQYAAQTTSYREQFPQARFDIIELGGERIGRIVVDRPGDELHVVDIAVSPPWRSRGIGTAIMRELLDEAAQAGVRVLLTVASSNDPSLRLYLRLGFVPIESVPLYLSLEWRPGAAPASAP